MLAYRAVTAASLGQRSAQNLSIASGLLVPSPPAYQAPLLTRHRWPHTHRSASAAAGLQPACACAAAADGPAQGSAAAGECARLAVFVSGGGSNLRAIHSSCREGRLRAQVQVRTLQASHLPLQPSFMSRLTLCRSSWSATSAAVAAGSLPRSRASQLCTTIPGTQLRLRPSSLWSSCGLKASSLRHLRAT